MTNADCIRAMTDEELAAYLPTHNMGAKFDENNPYHEKFLVWLKQKVSDNG